LKLDVDHVRSIKYALQETTDANDADGFWFALESQGEGRQERPEDKNDNRINSTKIIHTSVKTGDVARQSEKSELLERSSVHITVITIDYRCDDERKKKTIALGRHLGIIA
jgi:hypothetical protein